MLAERIKEKLFSGDKFSDVGFGKHGLYCLDDPEWRRITTKVLHFFEERLDVKGAYVRQPLLISQWHNKEPAVFLVQRKVCNRSSSGTLS